MQKPGCNYFKLLAIQTRNPISEDCLCVFNPMSGEIFRSTNGESSCSAGFVPAHSHWVPALLWGRILLGKKPCNTGVAAAAHCVPPANPGHWGLERLLQLCSVLKLLREWYLISLQQRIRFAALAHLFGPHTPQSFLCGRCGWNSQFCDLPAVNEIQPDAMAHEPL